MGLGFGIADLEEFHAEAQGRKDFVLSLHPVIPVKISFHHGYPLHSVYTNALDINVR